MSAMPMSLIKGTRSAKKERMDVQNRRSRIADRSRSIREKVTMEKKQLVDYMNTFFQKICTGNTFPQICNIGVKQELQYTFKSSCTCNIHVHTHL